MLCQNCKKHLATVHITEIVNQAKKEVHLCEGCAQEKGIAIKATFSIPDLLSGLPDTKGGKKTRDKLAALKCSNCSLTFEEFRKKGRFGCAKDYELFKTEIPNLLEKIHGSTRHTGKTPGEEGDAAARERKLTRLRSRLQQVVKEEAYEEAARLRDEINLLESGKHGKESAS